jgi:hypothetical protein
MKSLMFQPALTLANLAGNKTRTSRTKGLDKINKEPGAWTFAGNNYGPWNFDSAEERLSIRCPWEVGEEVYGKGTYYQMGSWLSEWDPIKQKDEWTFYPGKSRIIYYCDTKPSNLVVLKGHQSVFGYYKRSAMFMPETVSRYHIKINRIDCQRIQDITSEDCLKEGSYMAVDKDDEGGFVDLWDSINGKRYSWEVNPWVWSIYYDVVKKDVK